MTDKTPETLFTCDQCGRGNFTRSGLLHHVCKPKKETAAVAVVPKKTKLTLLSIKPEDEKKLETHGKNIKTYLGGVRKSGAALYGYMYLVGREINRVKDSEIIEHGQLTSWVSETFDLPQQTQNRWRQLADEIDAKIPTMGVLPESKKGKPLLLSSGKKSFSKAEVDQILQIIPEVMEGKNATDFLRDCKLVKEPQKPSYHPPREQSAEEIVAAENAQAEGLANGLICSVTVLMDDQLDTTLSRLAPAKRDELLDTLVRLTTAIRAFKPEKLS